MQSFAVTSFVSRTRCHVVGLSITDHNIRSAALNIAHKVTEFTFRADQRSRPVNGLATVTVHNSLIDCHYDVWTRFPVVPAVQQHVKAVECFPRSLIFVSDQDPPRFQAYFSHLIGMFESTTRKPVGSALSGISIVATTYDAFMKRRERGGSSFKTGEWLVHTLCLIPIHLAVARNNRFIPLKDGVWSPEQERHLLGATVDQVIDNLSFGWYESIFQSYMALKVRPRIAVTEKPRNSLSVSCSLSRLCHLWVSYCQAMHLNLDFEIRTDR